MDEYLKAVTCQICSQTYTDPRTLPCLHSFCLECLLKQLERQTVNSFQVQEFEQDNGTEKGPQTGPKMEGYECESKSSHPQKISGQVGPEEAGSEHKSSEKQPEPSGSNDRSEHNESKDGVMYNLKCPACELNVSITPREVSDLPQNLRLGFEAKVAQHRVKVATAHDVPCDSCIDGSSGPSVGFCCQCLHYLCQICCEQHKRSRDFHSHTLVTTGTEVTKEQLFPGNLPEPFCLVHEKKKLKLYCTECQELICHKCVTDTHKNHIDKIEIAQVQALSRRNEMKSLVTSTQETVKEFSCAIGKNMDMQQQLEALEEKATESIRQAIEKLHSILEERKQQLLSELQALIMCKKTRLGLQKEKLEKISQPVGCYLEFASKLLQNGTDQELIAMKQLPCMKLKAFLNKAKGENLEPCEHSNVTVAMDTDWIIKKVSGFKIIDFRPTADESIWKPKSSAIVDTKYKIRVEAKDSKGQPYPHTGVEIDVKAEMKPIAVDQPSCMGQVEKHRDGTYTISFIPKFVGSHQLHITMDDHYIKNSPYDLEVRKSKFKYPGRKQELRLGGIICSPLCIAIHKNSGDIFLGSEDNCIYVFDKAGCKKSTIGSNGSGCYQFNRPCGMDIKGDKLFVADCNNHRIQILDTNGSFVEVFGSCGQGEKGFCHPTAVLVDFHDRLIVADHGNHRIQILSSDGTFIASIDQSMSEDVGFKDISSIALDVQGNIHVAGIVGNCGWISVYTPRGEYVKKVKTVSKPNAMVIDIEGHVLVCDDETKSLYVSNSVGEDFVIAAKGLENPRGIALDKNTVFIMYNPPYTAKINHGYLLKYDV